MYSAHIMPAFYTHPTLQSQITVDFAQSDPFAKCVQNVNISFRRSVMPRPMRFLYPLHDMRAPPYHDTIGTVLLFVPHAPFSIFGLFFYFSLHLVAKKKNRRSSVLLFRCMSGPYYGSYRRLSFPTTRPQQEASWKSLRRMGGYLGFREIR